MTVAVAVKVFDGIVLATDSATTMQLAGGTHQVWNGADKIFHLHRKKPIAAMTWGLGSIGAASISTLAKDLRRRFMGRDPAHTDWALDDTYTVQGVAQRVVDLMYHELYAPLGASGVLGFLVAGYSAASTAPEAWQITVDGTSTVPVPTLAAGELQTGWLAFAQPAAVHRLFRGYDDQLLNGLTNVMGPAHMPAIQNVLNSQVAQPAVAPMPFGDAIALARFMVEVTSGYSHFLLGPNTVGGPTEVAGINRHEGFKWITRKHYYEPALNPGDPHP